MNSILWSQGKTPTENSVFVIDGEISSEQNSSVNQSAYEKLIRMNDLPAIHPNVVQFLQGRGCVVSRQLKITHKKGVGIFFKSVYESLDEVGRNITYMFFCKTDDIDYAYNIFCNASEKAGRKVRKSDEKIFKLLFRLNMYAVIFISIALILFLWKILD